MNIAGNKSGIDINSSLAVLKHANACCAAARSLELDIRTCVDFHSAFHRTDTDGICTRSGNGNMGLIDDNLCVALNRTYSDYLGTVNDDFNIT